MAPTNLLKHKSPPHRSAATGKRSRSRVVSLTAGRITVRARLLETPTADRIWASLPLRTTVETWGASIHFRTRTETGRERNARRNAAYGQVCYWVEQDRVILPFGPTPLSRPNEIRLPSPCNIWAETLDDPRVFADLRPGQAIVLDRA